MAKKGSKETLDPMDQLGPKEPPDRQAREATVVCPVCLVLRGPGERRVMKATQDLRVLRALKD